MYIACTQTVILSCTCIFVWLAVVTFLLNLLEDVMLQMPVFVSVKIFFGKVGVY